MSDAISKLRDYLAKSPSVIYPEDVLAYLPAIEAENVRLREQVDAAHMSRLLTENECEELRELVRDMMRFFEDGDWCDKCNQARECDSQEQYEDDCLMRLVFRDRMAQLGVEAE